MAKEKYVVVVDSTTFYSNSRNARKHMIENDSYYAEVYANTDDCPLLCRAVKYRGIILVGAMKRG